RTTSSSTPYLPYEALLFFARQSSASRERRSRWHRVSRLGRGASRRCAVSFSLETGSIQGSRLPSKAPFARGTGPRMGPRKAIDSLKADGADLEARTTLRFRMYSA